MRTRQKSAPLTTPRRTPHEGRRSSTALICADEARGCTRGRTRRSDTVVAGVVPTAAACLLLQQRRLRAQLQLPHLRRWLPKGRTGGLALEQPVRGNLCGQPVRGSSTHVVAHQWPSSTTVATGPTELLSWCWLVRRAGGVRWTRASPRRLRTTPITSRGW
jgi:hypothetical protein